MGNGAFESLLGLTRPRTPEYVRAERNKSNAASRCQLVLARKYVWDTLSARRFCGLAIEDPVPDHSTISRFRTRLVALGAWDGLLETVNDQLHARGMAVTVGAIVDARLTESPYSPKGGGRAVVAEDRKEARRRTEDLREEAVYHATKQQTHPNADHGGRWLKKGLV